MISKYRRKTVREAQQELAQNFGFGDDIIWDQLQSDEYKIMRNKIKQLIPDQATGQKSIEEMRSNIFDSVWKQRKYTNKMSVSSIFYVLVTKGESFEYALRSTEFSCHPVFRCKKCHKGSDTNDCCMIYVDEVGRVYQNWVSYIEENVLPAGIMVAPHKGIYNFDRQARVILEVYCTPNAKPEAQAMRKLQNGTAAVGFGAALVPLTALALPVAAPIMAVSAVLSLAVGGITAATSVSHLKDREKHGQSISLKNREARSCYLGVLGGTVGMAAAGATRVMTSMATAGKATKGIEVLVNGMNISSLALSGSGLVNGILDLIFKCNDGDEISAMEILQLSASLVLLTNSAYNFRLASQIVNDARNNSIKSYRETLSNRQRKMFDKMSKETMRIRGGTQGKIDILRAVNEIPDRQYLNDLYKTNKQLNQQKVRPSFGASGKNIVLNNEVSVNTGELRQSVQHQQGPNILSEVTQPIPSTHNSDSYTTQTPKEVKLFFCRGNYARSLDAAANEKNCEESLADLSGVLLANGSKIVFDFLREAIKKGISDFSKFEDVVLSMFNNLCAESAKFIMELAQTFIEKQKEEIEQIIKLFISTESVLFRMLKYVLDKKYDLDYKILSQKEDEILDAIGKYFKTLNSTDHYGKCIKCTHCTGMYVITQL